MSTSPEQLDNASPAAESHHPLEDTLDFYEQALKIDLNKHKYTAAFEKAEIFAKKGSVNAEQLTQEGLESGAYADKDIRYDEASGNYVVDTYVMHENEDGSRTAELEDTRPVEAGMWVLTNPVQQEGDHPNNYCQNDTTFQKRYEATDQPGVYRAKGMARIIKNETGRKVEIDDPWGTKQQGDENCYFCVPYDPDHPFNIPEGQAYILSENDFANYGPAAEVREDFVPLEDHVYAYQIRNYYDDDPDGWRYTCLDPRFPHPHPKPTDWYLQGKGKASGKDAVMSNEEFLAQYDSMPGDDNKKIYRRKRNTRSLDQE